MTARYLALEVRRTFRNRQFLLITLALPLVLFLVYHQLYGDDALGGLSATSYLMTSMAAFGAMVAAMSTGTRIAQERRSGWNRQLRLTPLRPASYLLAKGAVGCLVALPPIGLVYLAGVLVGGVDSDGWRLLASGLGAWLAAIPFAALGIAIGYLSNPDSSQALFSLAFLGLSLFGGVWIPVEVMPRAMADFAHALPSYWLGVIARTPLSTGGLDWAAIPVLLGWTVLLGLLVMRRYRVDTARA
jgi:ABC-2 type transport system permease protein